MREHRDDLDTLARALVRAANRGGGDDNITAVLFEIVEGETARGEPDEHTRELPAIAHDEEDTLHPEDGVQPPPSPVDTMVVSATEIEAALATENEQAERAGVGRRLLALLVIAVLVAVIVVLIWWGLAR
jgi:cobalamin biosynthesis Mg chelatase CobN